MLSILKFSGKHWLRSATAWVLLAVVVDGLAKAGAEAADAKLAAYNAAVALGVLTAAERGVTQGQRQVAKVDVTDLRLEKLEISAFGDLDEAGHPPD